MPRQIPEAVIAASATVTRRHGDGPVTHQHGDGNVTHQHGDGPVTVVGIMESVLATLVASSSAPGAVRSILGTVDLVVTPRGTWADTDPGRAALRRLIPETTATSIITEIGVLQQTAIHMAVEAVINGDARAALVLGGEAKYSIDRLGAGSDADGSSTEPDEIVRPSGDIVHPLEIATGAVMPVQQYALIESALAIADGRTMDQHARAMAGMWASGSATVLERPDAWRDRPVAIDDVLASDTNPPLASPYTRAVVSSWTVDQAVALLVTSASAARSSGLDDDDLVGLVGSAVSDHMVPLVAREDLTGCPALHIGSDEIERTTGRRPGDADLADLYSCFPSAVQVAARELGRDLDRGWTVTGGMATYGGPFNSYALHAVAVMAERLRASPPGTSGVTTCISGLLTKAAVALWQRGPATTVLIEVTDDDRRARHTMEVVDLTDLDEATLRVVAWTDVPIVSGDEQGAMQRIEIVEDAGRRRSLRVQIRR